MHLATLDPNAPNSGPTVKCGQIAGNKSVNGAAE
jgi:hypothetical protein